MIVSGSRLRQIGWAVVFAVCIALFGVLTFRVNAVKSQVLLAERQIIALESEKLILETEFQARASQQQLANWNRIEYGYAAPNAEQYLDSERDLAALGMARIEGAPEPIRIARKADEAGDGVLSFVSPLTGRALGDEELAQPSGDDDGDHHELSASLSDRLSGSGRLTGRGTGMVP